MRDALPKDLEMALALSAKVQGYPTPEPTMRLRQAVDPHARDVIAAQKLGTQCRTSNKSRCTGRPIDHCEHSGGFGCKWPNR